MPTKILFALKKHDIMYPNANVITRAEMAKSLVGTGREPVQEPPNHHPGTVIVIYLLYQASGTSRYLGPRLCVQTLYKRISVVHIYYFELYWNTVFSI